MPKKKGIKKDSDRTIYRSKARTRDNKRHTHLAIRQ